VTIWFARATRLTFLLRLCPAVPQLLTNPLFWTTLEIVVYPFVSPTNVKEVLTVHLPDGSLAPLLGAEVLLRILPPKSTL